MGKEILGYPRCEECGLIYGGEQSLMEHLERDHKIITIECESCHNRIDARESAWDWEQDREVCVDCYNENRSNKINEREIEQNDCFHNYEKYQAQHKANGEWVIYHKCTKCGKVRKGE